MMATTRFNGVDGPTSGIAVCQGEFDGRFLTILCCHTSHDLGKDVPITRSL
jgi:hypothetical protein